MHAMGVCEGEVVYLTGGTTKMCGIVNKGYTVHI